MKLSPEVQAQLLTLGVQVVAGVIEKRTGRKVDEMTDAEALEAIAAIQVRPVDELIEEGRLRAGVQEDESAKCVWCGKSYLQHTELPNPNGAVPRMPCMGLRSGFMLAP